MYPTFLTIQSTDEDIAQTEQSCLVSFPSAYKEFLLKHNGGMPKPDYYKSSIDGSGVRIHVFLGIKREPSDFVSYYFTYENRIPDDLIPIAFNQGGDVICLGWKGERLNKVYIWWHDYECEEDAYPCYDNIDLIADSFEEFINGFSEA